MNDVLIENPSSSTGYSQIDHIIISPHSLFVIETKNYQGTIYGGKKRKTWLVNGKFPFRVHSLKIMETSKPSSAA
ncbi:NERD domain-containing protein [Bacillus zhangzhouensis]|nr:NERD domain-containing protein [Bacillus zhangzhouensis]